MNVAREIPLPDSEVFLRPFRSEEEINSLYLGLRTRSSPYSPSDPQAPDNRKFWESVKMSREPLFLYMGIFTASKVLGDISFEKTSDEFHSYDVEFNVVREERGKGYATLALGALTKYLVDHQGARRVEALVKPDNTAARKVLEKCGFEEGETYNGLLTSYNYQLLAKVIPFPGVTV